jgi:hypothetical protein
MATLKNTIVNDTGYLGMPIGTTAQRPGSPANGYMRVNSTASTIEMYYGGIWNTVSSLALPSATGGIITTSGNYKIHTFIASGTLTVTSAPAGTAFEILMVGGGGSSGGYSGGGAGGEVLYTTAATLAVQAYSIVIGAGGTSPTGNGGDIIGNPGSVTTAFGETAKAGGGGKGSDSSTFPSSSTYANGGGVAGAGTDAVATTCPTSWTAAPAHAPNSRVSNPIVCPINGSKKIESVPHKEISAIAYEVSSSVARV